MRVLCEGACVRVLCEGACVTCATFMLAGVGGAEALQE